MDHHNGTFGMVDPDTKAMKLATIQVHIVHDISTHTSCAHSLLIYLLSENITN
jgi:hypothetical protein